MFLKSIELFGFKSFADRSRIEFADGISALLGPNGCGKSNVVDAIKWVLGEQATKSLRAERMEDVIFNGTEDRKAVNVAEVTLTMVNEDEILPIDTAEIAIRRRLFRSGESEYFLNGTPVKLKELRELFYDTGIGKTAYSIMEQGKIDQVLSNKPEERRLIFEEAAGITKYKMRGKEAERKLERTEENMRQVDGILGEVSRTYESLRKQAEKTLKYRELRTQIFEAELDLTLIRLRTHVDEQDKRSEQLEKKSAARDALKAQIDEINESLEENLDVVNEMEAKLIEHQKRLYGVELEKNNRENQIRIHTERVSELEEKIQGDRARQKALEEKIEALRTEIGGLQTAIGEHRERVKDVDANIASFQEHIEHSEARIKENRAAIERNEAEIARQDERQLELENALRELTDDIVKQLDEGLAQSGYSQGARKEHEAKVRAELAELEKRLRHHADLLGDAQAAGKHQRAAEAATQMVEAVREQTSVLSRAVEAFAESVPAFLDEFLAPEGIITRKREVDAELATCRETVRSCRAEIARLGEENAGLATKIDEYRGTLEELRMNRVRMTTQITAMEESVASREGSVREQERLVEQHGAEIETGKKRLTETSERITTLGAELAELGKRETEMQAEQKKLEESIFVRNNDLVQKERGLKQRMEELGKTQSRLEKLQMSSAEISAEIRNLYENFRDRYSQELSEHEPRMLEITASPADLRARVAQLREDERSLGAVNLAAPEEFEEVKQRYEFLSEQLSDLRQAREDLERVTNEIQSESAALFAQTYEQVKKNFHVMFRRLFGGGRAELKLTDPENILESGIEILAQPPGKKLENIALLSGGERSLTAVGLLFATYMVRPSPFCLLDEIDAALDESNVARFTNMLMEFGKSSQFIVITHNKKTVASASTLLGITMEENGVSKVVAIRIGGREEVHAS
ncbi:MAG: chromosome segregation SMC family protein [Spirochaetota bacterium]